VKETEKPTRLPTGQQHSLAHKAQHIHPLSRSAHKILPLSLSLSLSLSALIPSTTPLICGPCLPPFLIRFFLSSYLLHISNPPCNYHLYIYYILGFFVLYFSFSLWGCFIFSQICFRRPSQPQIDLLDSHKRTFSVSLALVLIG
jgi:hypothetical protein